MCINQRSLKYSTAYYVRSLAQNGLFNQSINQWVSLYFRHWAHRTVKLTNIKQYSKKSSGGYLILRHCYTFWRKADDSSVEWMNEFNASSPVVDLSNEAAHTIPSAVEKEIVTDQWECYSWWSCGCIVFCLEASQWQRQNMAQTSIASSTSIDW